MRTGLVLFTMTVVVVLRCPPALAQEWTNDGFGNIHCDPNLPPLSVTIGDGTTVNQATLNVRGDQLPVTDAFAPAFLSTFRTDVGAQLNQSWSMVRGQLQVGRFYHTNPDNAFRIQAVQPNGTDPGILYLENSTLDGFMLRANGLQNTVNNYPLRLDGFASLGIRAAGTNGMPSRSRFQLVDIDAQAVVEPWRPYYRNGVLLTGNNDMAYIGHRYHDASNGTMPWTYTLDRSDLLISAGENDMTDALRQRIRFTYTTTPDALAVAGAATYNGLEFMQLYPSTATEGFVGIGDFTVANDAPQDRLDVRNGDVRVRDLPLNANERPNFDRFVVVNSTTGELRWRNINTVPGAPDCDWDLDAPNMDLSTAWNPSAVAGCPAQNWKVGIGKNSGLTGKLTVLDDLATNGATLGIDVKSVADGSVDTGIKSLAIGLNSNGSVSSYATGVDAKATDATTTIGVNSVATLGSGLGGTTATVFGLASKSNVAGTANVVAGVESYGVLSNTASVTQLYGTLGVAQNTLGGSVAEMFGAYGKAAGQGTSKTVGILGDAVTCGTCWAGRFEGAVHITGNLTVGGTFPMSDGLLKQNEVPIANATDVLTQIDAMTYQFDTANYTDMQLPGGMHSGVIAQNLLTVLPHLVKEFTHPAKLDSLGNVLTPAFQFLGVNYDELVPYLIAGFKEQNTELVAVQQTVAQQQQQITTLLQQITACCLLNDGPLFQGTGNTGTTGQEEVLRNSTSDQLTIIPNPIADRTTITYRSDARGRVALRVSDGRGQHIDTLRDQTQDAGTYSYDWNTQGLAAGSYTVTLLLNDQVLVQRVVKLGD